MPRCRIWPNVSAKVQPSAILPSSKRWMVMPVISIRLPVAGPKVSHLSDPRYRKRCFPPNKRADERTRTADLISLRAIRACRAVVWPALRKSEARTPTTAPRPSYYHLRYHFWAGARRDSQGSNNIVTEQMAHKQGPNGNRSDSTRVRNGSLRIRRPQVRVLPSALLKVLQNLGFSFFSQRLS
jgi:hypothetical protein